MRHDEEQVPSREASPRIRELHDGSLPANVQLKLRWDGRDGNGRNVANGTYFIVAKASGNEQSDRRVLPVVKMR